MTVKPAVRRNFGLTVRRCTKPRVHLVVDDDEFVLLFVYLLSVCDFRNGRTDDD